MTEYLSDGRGCSYPAQARLTAPKPEYACKFGWVFDLFEMFAGAMVSVGLLIAIGWQINRDS